MSEASYSYFWFGGSFIKKLEPLLQEQGTVSGKLTGISPISEINSSMPEENGPLTRWLPELDARLAECGADYFLLDLQPALQKLLVSGNGRSAATAENQSRLTGGELAVVDPIVLPQKAVDQAMEGLAAVIAKHFPAGRIILIHTHNSSYWLAGKSLRTDNSPAPDESHSKWLGELEQQFCRLTGCHFVDVTKFYFYKKEAGRPLTNVIYENKCYLDVMDRILDITRGGDGKAGRPNFAYSLDRYVAYCVTMLRKPQRVFLNPKYFLNQLILAASDTFVKTYREELIELDKLDWTEPQEALDALDSLRPDSEIAKVCNAFYAAVNGNYTDESVDYSLMFRMEVVPEEVIAWLREEYAPRAKLHEKQINRHNAGFHFARMLGLDPEPFMTALTVERPTLIDVFGSCIGRTLFNVQENDFAVNRYWFHVPPFEFRNKPVKYEPGLFGEKPNWTDRLVRQQLDCGVYRAIRESESQWLVVDLYSLVGPNNYYYEECVFSDFDHRIAQKLKAQKISFMNGQNPIGSAEQVIAALDPWLNVIRKKYGDKIILVECRRTDYWIGDDNKIYHLASPSSCNDMLKAASDYVVEKLGCYVVDICDFFLPDECGLMRNTPMHKEDLFYQSAHDIVRQIVDTLPEQKRFERYSGRLHMRRLIRLARKNSLEVLEQALPLNELDRAVIRLGHERMRLWVKELVKICHKSDRSMSLEEVIASCGVSKDLAAALREAARTPKGKTPKLKSAYTRYTAGDGVIGGEAGTCNLPPIPEVKLNRIDWDGSGITLNWTSSKAANVRIYRRGREAGWVLVGKSGGGSYTDTTALPQDAYAYSLCAEVLCGDMTYLGSFTPPREVTPAEPGAV